MRLLFATHNDHKAQEVREILAHEGLSVEIVTLKEIGDMEELAEEGETLHANALQKALQVWNRHGIPCIADDTGLQVKALNGAPGVYSARYAGVGCSAEENVQKLLKELHATEDREAHFTTIIALIIEGRHYFFEGKIEGEITREKRGEKGFGYDPIFRPKGEQKTFAELSPAEKNQLSHRFQATRSLVQYLKKL